MTKIASTMQEAGTQTGLVIAVDIGGTKIAAGLVSVGHDHPQISGLRSIATEAHLGGTHVLSRVEGMVRELMVEAEGEVLGIGVATAGVVGSDGTVLSATDLMPGWGGTPLSRSLADTFDVPVSVLGDVEAHALGELRHSVGMGLDHGSMLVVAVGTGVGGAVVMDGCLVRGAHNIAGHLGHVQHPQATGIVCSCGRTGHVESVSSGSGIMRRYEEITGRSSDGAQISRLAAEGEPQAMQVIADAAQALGETLGSLVNALDPQIVVVSGSVSRSGELWVTSLHRGFRSQAMDDVQDTPVLLGTLGSEAPLLGAYESLLSHIGHPLGSPVWL